MGGDEEFFPGVSFLETSIRNTAPSLLIISAHPALPGGWHRLPTPMLGEVFETI